MKLVVGLGNPGKEYEHTRHNVGFMVVDALAGDASWKYEKKWNAEVARVGDAVYYKPQTFMNDSGIAVRAMMDFYKIAAQDVVAVYDDKDLPFGIVRLRSNGSSAGHNGVKSLIAYIGGMDFARVRVGIASDAMHGDTADYVLARFSKDQSAVLPKVIAAACDGVRKILAVGISKQTHEDIAAIEDTD